MCSGSLRMTRVNATEYLMWVSALPNRYASTSPVEDVSLAVEDGVPFGFQAPNGADEPALLNRSTGPWHISDWGTAIEFRVAFTWREPQGHPVLVVARA